MRYDSVVQSHPGEQGQITVPGRHDRELSCEITSATFHVTTRELLIPGDTVRLSSGTRQVTAQVLDCTRLDNDDYSISLQTVGDPVNPLGSVTPDESRPSAAGLSRRVGLSKLLIVAVAAGAVVIGFFFQRTYSPIAGSIQAAESVFPSQPSPADVPAPAGAAVQVSIRATNLSWVASCADGQKQFEGLLQQGDTVKLTFSETAIVRSGNAGGTEVTYDGKPPGRMGSPGEIRMLRITRKGYDYLPPAQSQSCLTQ